MSEQTKSSYRKDAHIALALEPLAMAAIDAGFDNVRLDHYHKYNLCVGICCFKLYMLYCM